MTVPIDAKANTLRTIADWLDAHPDFPAYEVHISRWTKTPSVRAHGLDREEMAALVKSIGGRWKKHAGEYVFTISTEIAPGVHAELHGSRDEICERVVVGTETITHRAVDLPERVEVVEKVEWRCAPVLEGRLS